jgi:hypothetical protein
MRDPRHGNRASPIPFLNSALLFQPFVLRHATGQNGHGLIRDFPAPRYGSRLSGGRPSTRVWSLSVEPALHYDGALVRAVLGF